MGQIIFDIKLWIIISVNISNHNQFDSYLHSAHSDSRQQDSWTRPLILQLGDLGFITARTTYIMYDELR